MKYRYKTSNTCSHTITFRLDGDTVKNVVFYGGCNGNLKAIPRLIEGMKISELNEKLHGIMCGSRPTSCTDQLLRAVNRAYKMENP